MSTYNNWEWDTSTKTYLPVMSVAKCHTGNTAVYSEKNGGTLFIGGWNNGAVVTPKTHVIDLSGSEAKFQDIPTAYDKTSLNFLSILEKKSIKCAGWLSLPFPDMSIPSMLTTYAQWKQIAGQIRGILKSGNDVLVACLGGHGRSGLFCAIVGYILNHNKNKDWEKPVEHIRKIHCDDAVETYAQEKYVYKILGLSLTIDESQYKTYTDYKAGAYYGKTTETTWHKCPICGTDSQYVKTYNMCLACHNKYMSLAKEVTDITEDDLNNVEHACASGKNCLGIFKASLCGHVVHDMIVYDGLCENCAWEAEYAKKVEDETKSVMEKGEITYGKCAVCEKTTAFGYRFGICWECAEDLKKRGAIDNVHNSLTDAYKTPPHSCNNVICNGIAIADVCGHVVHDREIIDGLCPECLAKKTTEYRETTTVGETIIDTMQLAGFGRYETQVGIGGEWRVGETYTTREKAEAGHVEWVKSAQDILKGEK